MIHRFVVPRTARPDPLTHRVVLGVTALAIAAGAVAWVVTRRGVVVDDGAGSGMPVDRAVMVMREPLELYHAWHDLSRRPRFMPHLESVTPLDGTRSRWVARGPGGLRLTWEAEIAADEPGRLIAWRSIGGDVDTAGSVRFTPAPANRGTEVKVHMRYVPPAGRVGAELATILGQGGDRQVREDLRRFKQIMETGEPATAAPLAYDRRR